MTVKQFENTFVLQQDQSDCGVACLLTLIRYYGGDYSLEKLRVLSGTTKQGTTLLGLYQASSQLGFDVQGNKADLESLKNHNRPLILHVLIEERYEHYVICYGYEEEVFIIGDPAKGITKYSEEELINIWSSGNCLTLLPNQRLVKSQPNKESKKKWFLKLLKEDSRLIGFSILLGLCMAILGMSMVVFSQKLIDDILPSKNLNKLISGITLLTFLLLTRVGFAALRDYFLIRQTKDFNNRIIGNFYSLLLNLTKPFFDSRKIGELVARLNDTQRIQKVIKTVVENMVIDILVTLVSFVFLFHYSWEVGLIAILSLPLYFLLVYNYNSIIIISQRKVMRGYALSESHYINSIQGISAIKNNNKQNIFQKLNTMIYGNFQEKVFDLGKINVRLSLVSGVFGVVFLVTILAYTSVNVYWGNMLLGELMAVIGIAGSLLPSVANLALITIPINEAKVAFERMFEFVSIEGENTGVLPLVEFKSLDIENLSFNFAGRNELLENINISIVKNQCIALVGESGSGKSSLGLILQKFYAPKAGEILINNKYNLRNISLFDWRKITGVVPQEVTIFNGSVVNNILLGEENSRENVLKFCSKYGFDFLINRFPQKYDTLLGEEGLNLSGGERQIMALMRALYKKPQLLILDEFTSAMDRKTEHFVLDLLNRLKSELSIIFISHRLHSLKKIADKIYVIEDGITKVSGNHSELMKSKNFYSDFWRELED